MLEHNASKVSSEILAIAEFGKMLNRWAQREPAEVNPIFLPRDFEQMRSIADELYRFCTANELAGSKPAAERLLSEMRGSHLTIDGQGNTRPSRIGVVVLARSAEDLAMRVLDELGSRSIYWVPARATGLVQQTEPLFGQIVLDAFPSASSDVAEAGMCLGLGRWTAAVMHLMRASEVCLKALAGMLGVANQNDWGSYLRKIGDELDVRVKISGKKTPDEEFYSEAAATFDRVRRAWRNSTMHVDRSYSEERATEIYLGTKSLMQHLAPRVHE